MEQKIIDAIEKIKENEISELKEKVPTYLDTLDEKQKIAATNIYGNFLVIAGPGAGKTHTMIFRIVHMIQTGINPKEICMITFTRKSALEMKRRLDFILPGVELGFIGTFHSLANNMMLSYGPSRKRFRLIDDEDNLEILKLVKNTYNIKFDYKIKMSAINKIFSYRYNTLCSIEEALIEKGYEEYRVEIDKIKELEKRYIKYKAARNFRTYDDILADCSDSKYPNNFKYLIVDEYQDTNNLQINFIKNNKFENIMAVGDDMQSIYSFRGANNEIILNFANDFEDAKLIRLDNNYRSSKKIVEAINDVANSSLYKFDKQLVTSNKEGDDVEIIPVFQKDFKDLIIDKVKEKEDESHAVIYRTNNEKKYLEPELIKLKIPYAVYGGVKLLDRKHIKDILSILLTNMSKADEISFSRLLKMCKGIGEISAQKIIYNYPNISFVKMSKQLSEVLDIIEDESLSLNEVLEKAIKWYLANPDVIMKSSYEKEDIENDIESLKRVAEDYEDKYNFVNDLVLDPAHDFKSQKEKVRVVLTTIHSSKGLEFDNVYYIHQLMYFQMYSTKELEESRRLLYVAISRAKKKLFILDQKEYERKLKELLFDFSNDNYLNVNNEFLKDDDFFKNLEQRLKDFEGFSQF